MSHFVIHEIPPVQFKTNRAIRGGECAEAEIDSILYQISHMFSICIQKRTNIFLKDMDRPPMTSHQFIFLQASKRFIIIANLNANKQAIKFWFSLFSNLYFRQEIHRFFRSPNPLFMKIFCSHKWHPLLQQKSFPLLSSKILIFW